MLIIPFICIFFFFSNNFFFSTDFSALMRAKVFKLCIHLQRVEVYCAQENHEASIYFAFFSISHSNVMHRERGGGVPIWGFFGPLPNLFIFGR